MALQVINQLSDRQSFPSLDNTVDPPAALTTLSAVTVPLDVCTIQPPRPFGPLDNPVTRTPCWIRAPFLAQENITDYGLNNKFVCVLSSLIKACNLNYIITQCMLV